MGKHHGEISEISSESDYCTVARRFEMVFMRPYI